MPDAGRHEIIAVGADEMRSKNVLHFVDETLDKKIARQQGKNRLIFWI